MSNPLLASDIAEICSGLEGEAQFFAGKKILITGARGFLGRYMTKVFVKLNETVLSHDKCQVIAVDNHITSGEMGADSADRDSEAPTVTFHEADVAGNVEVLEEIAGTKIDYILHLAGIASPFYYRKWPLETLDVATHGLRNALDIAQITRAKLLFFSSSEIYGNPDVHHVPTPESYNGNVSCLGPRACYDESKRLGETLVRIYHTHRGVEGTIVRPFNVYGPGMQKLDYRVLPNFASKILSGKPVSIYGDGNQTRTFCYITDAIVGFLKVLVKGQSGEPYNIGNPSPEISMLGLIETLRESMPELDVKFNVIEHPDTYPADEPLRRCPDITKARLQVGYEPVITLGQGLRRFFGWAKEAYAE